MCAGFLRISGIDTLAATHINENCRAKNVHRANRPGSSGVGIHDRSPPQQNTMVQYFLVSFVHE